MKKYINRLWVRIASLFRPEHGGGEGIYLGECFDLDGDAIVEYNKIEDVESQTSVCQFCHGDMKHTENPVCEHCGYRQSQS